jgi:hypothetical protein
MNEEAFWRIIENAGAPDRCSPDDQCERITKSLASMSTSDLVEFENLRHQLLVKAYTWPMLKACFIVLSYVSDDVFEDFRHWIILNGQSRFYRTIEDPDVMAEYIQVQDPIEEITGEPLMFVCENAWDGDIEDIEKDVVYPNTPAISDDWPPKEQLRAEFPTLFEQFWNEDRIREIHGGS